MKQTLGILANYFGDDRVFWKTLTIMVDGKRYYKSISSGERNRDSDGDEVWETGDYVASSSDVEMLRAIASSKEAIVRFQGDNYHYDHTIPAKDKTGIAQVLAAYVE